MLTRATTVPAQIAELIVRLQSLSLGIYYVLLSAAAQKLKIGMKRHQDGKQSNTNDTQTSNPCSNHTN